MDNDNVLFGSQAAIQADTAIEGYRTGRFSHRQVGQMLGLDYWQTEAFFQKHGVRLNYSRQDLEADRATWKDILASLRDENP